jgi:hypothetical protein
MTVVNSWNEWDPLREVIVGSASPFREQTASQARNCRACAVRLCRRLARP